MQLSFLGAADTVTGSRHLAELGGQRVLLDCGLYQGFKVFRERNWQPPTEAMRGADAVVLSHAHLDHSGYLPALVRDGFTVECEASPSGRGSKTRTATIATSSAPACRLATRSPPRRCSSSTARRSWRGRRRCSSRMEPWERPPLLQRPRPRRPHQRISTDPP